MSGLLLDKDSVQVNGSKVAPVLTLKIQSSLVEGKPALRSPSMRQNMPEVLFSFCAVIYFQTHFLYAKVCFLDLSQFLLLRDVIHIIVKGCFSSLDADLHCFFLHRVKVYNCVVLGLSPSWGASHEHCKHANQELLHN